MRFVQAAVMVLGCVLWVGVLAGGDAFSHDGGTDQLYVVVLVVIGVWNLILAVVTVLAIVDAVVKVRRRTTDQLATGVFVVKLAGIPFFVVNFLLLAAISVATYVLGGVGAIIAAVTIPLTYLAMLTTSVYGWAALAALRRDQRLTTPLVVLYAILLCLFVADIVAGILIFAHAVAARRAAVTPPLVAA